MTKIDKAALELALEMVLTGKDLNRAEQVRLILEEDGWRQAAKFCSYYLQMRRLRLKPWERPPCRLDRPDDSEAGRLLGRMLAAGMSKYDPDPLAAMEDAAREVLE